MKRITLILAAICIFLNSRAQVTIEEGSALPPVDNGKITKIIGGDQTNFYVMREDGKGKGQHYFVEQYALADFSKKFSVLISATESAENIDSYFVGEKVIVFYSTQASKTAPASLFVSTVDVNGTAAATKEIITVNSKAPAKDVYVASSYYFTLTISPDQKHFAVIARDFENKGKDQKGKLIVLDANTLMKEWEMDIPAKGAHGFVISNACSVSWVVYDVGDDADKVIIADVRDKSLSEVKIRLHAPRIAEGICLVPSGNNLVIGGIFKEIGVSEKAGTFFRSYDLSSKKVTNSADSYLSEEQMKKIFVEEDDFKGKFMDVDNGRVIDGEFYFIGKDVEAETRYHQHTSTRTVTDYSRPSPSGMGYGTKTVSRTTSNASRTYETTRNIVFKINKDGMTEWIKDIPSGSVIGRSPVEVLVSGNINLRPDVADFEIDKHLVVIHANALMFAFSMKATMVSYSLFEKNGEVDSRKLCLDDKDCFVYNGMGTFGFTSLFFGYGKNIIVYYNQKDNQHFGRIVFK
jgi:hypothetical protein